MWKYKGDELGLEGITGIPTRDMTDEEFGEAEAKQALKFPDQPGSLSKCGLWVHEEDEKPKAETRTSSRVASITEEDKTSDVEKASGEEENNG